MGDPIRRRAEEIFLEIIELPADERRLKVERYCAGDAGLAAEVAALLQCDDRNDDQFLERPPLEARNLKRDSCDGPTGQELVSSSEWLGRYSIVRQIGQGGMGAVYEARQENPRRTVALKVIRPGLGSTGLLRRFEFEAQVLGQLQHPGIAAIYEAGSIETPNGRQPFFAMEYVNGRPLTAHAEEKRLGTRERLELMARICEGVQHAHDKGVIHRDLKPANILMDEQGQPKILDFGIARATNADIQMVTMQTDVGQLVGTLPYMSPEQVSGDSQKLDLRTDVYSLGVILYELLAGRLPHDIRNCSIPEAVRIINERDPSRLSSISTRLRGDIETIVAKALERDKQRRYATAAELAADIRRYLRDEPLHARPASAFYQWRKFAKRHKGLVGGIAATVVALVVGTIASLQYAIQAAAQEAVAQRQAYRASLVAAEAAMTNQDVDEAARQLQAAPASLRGWEWDYFHARLDQSLVSIAMGDRRPFAAVAIAEDGQAVMTLRTVGDSGQSRSADGLPPAERRLQLLTCDPWSTAIPLFENGPPARAREVTSYAEVLLTRTGAKIVSIKPGACRIQDALTGDRQVTIESDRIDNDCHLSWASDEGRHVVLGGDNRFVTIDADSKRVDSFPAIGYWPRGVSPDCSLVAVIPESTRIVVQKVPGGAIVRDFTVPSTQLSALAFSNDNRYLVSGDFDGVLRCFSLTDEQAPWQTIRIGGRVYSIYFSPDGAMVAAARKNNILLFSAQTGEQVGSFVGHRGPVDYMNFATNGKLLCSTGADSSGRVWDIESQKDPCVLRGHELWVNPVAISPDGSLIGSGSYDGTVRIWDAISSDPVAVLRVDPQRVGSDKMLNIRGLAWSPDGSLLAVYHDRISVLDAYTGQTLATLDAPTPHQRSIAFSPGGERLVAPAYSWAVSDQRVFAILPGPPGTKFVVFSPDGKLLATGGPNNSIQLVNAASGVVLRTLYGHAQQALEAAFSIDGKRLATASEDHAVRLWDVGRGREVAVLRDHTDKVYGVAFSPDGRRLASCGADNTIRLWNTTTLEQVAQLRGHEDYVWSIAWSPDGRMLVSGSGDHTVRIWETQPLATRLRARHERRRLVQELRPRVERLLAPPADPRKIVQHFRADSALSAREREVALQIVLETFANTLPP